MGQLSVVDESGLVSEKWTSIMMEERKKERKKVVVNCLYVKWGCGSSVARSLPVPLLPANEIMDSVLWESLENLHIP